MQKDALKLANFLKSDHTGALKVDYLLLPDENHATILHQSISEAFKLLFPYKEP